MVSLAAIGVLALRTCNAMVNGRERGGAAERGAMTAADRQRYPSHDGGAVPTDIWHAMSGSGGGVREGRAWEQVGGAVVVVGVAGGHLKRQHQWEWSA